MFGIGLTELIIILVIALVAIGPDKLPEMMKVLGRTFGEFKKATQELKNSVHDTVGDVKESVDVGVEIEEVLKIEKDEPRAVKDVKEAKAVQDVKQEKAVQDVKQAKAVQDVKQAKAVKDRAEKDKGEDR